MTSIRDEIMGLPVFDTHTHLETGWRSGTDGFYARNFFDICDYFWFRRELIGVGYDREETFDPRSLTEAENLHNALRKNRNTFWTGAILQAMDDLYDIRPDTPQRILELGEVMDANLTNRDWGLQVCDKIGIKKTVMGPGGTPEGTKVHVDVDVISGRDIRVPALGIGKGLPSYDPDDPNLHLKVDALKEELTAAVDGFRADGLRVVRAAWPFRQVDAAKKDFTTDELRDTENLHQYLGHFLFELFEKYGFMLQIFFGNGNGGPVNDPRHVPSMWPIFDMYGGINFELFSMAQLSAMDMVQAARIYTNVYPGGLWWYCFRPSVYEESMKYRSEGISATRSTFVASDARCIEWSYIKIRVIKKVMGQFLEQQVKNGWMDEDAALFTARQWLHDTAEHLYCR